MAKDIFHDNVREAIRKEGWIVTAEQWRIDLEVTYLEVDLMAENLLIADKGGEKIAVEVKSFVQKSIIYTFHEAIGQYLDCQSALKEIDPNRIVFLALPIAAYNNEVFQGRFIQKRLREENINLIVFDPITNTVEKWIKQANTAAH